ncbi:hypothetical protein CRG98_030987 [Punica granatum]|uniref:Uncharacterized protein n=1 Tax=Punica granatum TaxID=22663 RepID=A0A2I0IX77_PUNGR|nr:hypothetical protein CRG98_030987 [Punica granatum]
MLATTFLAKSSAASDVAGDLARAMAADVRPPPLQPPPQARLLATLGHAGNLAKEVYFCFSLNLPFFVP